MINLLRKSKGLLLVFFLFIITSCKEEFIEENQICDSGVITPPISGMAGEPKYGKTIHFMSEHDKVRYPQQDYYIVWELPNGNKVSGKEFSLAFNEKEQEGIYRTYVDMGACKSPVQSFTLKKGEVTPFWCSSIPDSTLTVKSTLINTTKTVETNKLEITKSSVFVKRTFSSFPELRFNIVFNSTTSPHDEIREGVFLTRGKWNTSKPIFDISFVVETQINKFISYNAIPNQYIWVDEVSPDRFHIQICDMKFEQVTTAKEKDILSLDLNIEFNK